MQHNNENLKNSEKNSQQRKKQEQINLAWMDPDNGALTPAGVAVYNQEKNCYRLLIIEEPREKKYFLRPVGMKDGKISYIVELSFRLGRKKFRKERVGSGFSNAWTGEHAHINYGSKYKTLVVFLGEEKREKRSPVKTSNTQQAQESNTDEVLKVA